VLCTRMIFPDTPSFLNQIRGATTHYDAVVSAATSGVLGASTDTGEGLTDGDRCAVGRGATTCKSNQTQRLTDPPAAEGTGGCTQENRGRIGARSGPLMAATYDDVS
jgi:hypothetical protein